LLVDEFILKFLSFSGAAAGITKPIVSVAIIADLYDHSVEPRDNEGKHGGFESSIAAACPVLFFLFIYNSSN
jgi:hypothetical protein